jgi:hypothetical protein
MSGSANLDGLITERYPDSKFLHSGQASAVRYSNHGYHGSVMRLNTT